MLYLQIEYDKGLIFTDAKDAIAFVDAVSKAIPVTKEGYGEKTTYTKSNENLIRTLEAINPSQVIAAPVKEEEEESSS